MLSNYDFSITLTLLQNTYTAESHAIFFFIEETAVETRLGNVYLVALPSRVWATVFSNYKDSYARLGGENKGSCEPKTGIAAGR